MFLIIKIFIKKIGKIIVSLKLLAKNYKKNIIKNFFINNFCYFYN